MNGPIFFYHKWVNALPCLASNGVVTPPAQFYISHLEKQLKPAEYLTLKNLVYLLQSQKQVSIELLASLMPYPIQFKSRRRSLQRFLNLDSLNIERLWFPIVKEILQAKFPKCKPLKIALDRTQWRSQNVFMLTLVWEKRGIPLYWQLLDKRGSSNIDEQQALITPVLELLSGYSVIAQGGCISFLQVSEKRARMKNVVKP